MSTISQEDNAKEKERITIGNNLIVDYFINSRLFHQ